MNRLWIAGIGVLAVVVGAVMSTVSGHGETEVETMDARMLLRLLRESPNAILERIPVEPVELSMPTDGQGARVLVRVLPGEAKNVPTSLTIAYEDGEFVVPLEISETYETYRAE